MKLAKYQWDLPEVEDLNTKIDQLKKAGVTYSPAFLRLCLARGLKTDQAIQAACSSQPTLFHDPALLYDMDRAVERIHHAIGECEPILIYGDYDADGITSTLIVKEAIEALGGEVHYYLPDRFQDGYGPNLDRYREWIDQGIQLIITVDNGVAGHEAIAYAQDRGVDVIVTDHHEIQASLPAAYAIIHPRHPQGNYPFGELAGAGVALKLATALLDELPAEAIELAAIGTVADMVSVVDENRTIIQTGIRMLVQTSRIGLKQLLDQEQVTQEALSTDTIGFIIGPRLNELGRLGDASPGLEWLSSHDPSHAKDYLDQMNAANQKRQALVNQILKEVEDQVANQTERPNIIIASGENWHPGVLGIVASRIVDKYQRPTLLFHYDPQKGHYKGSGRSVPAVHLFDWLSSIQSLLLQFGGHSQAAGMTVSEANWPAFKDQLRQLADQAQERINQPPRLKVDLIVQAEEVTPTLFEEIQALGPFGMDNPKPILVLDQAYIQDKRLMGVDKQHVKLILQAGENPGLSAVAFAMADRMQEVQAETRLSIAGQVSLNQWQNKPQIQVLVKDFGYPQGQWVDYRGSQIHSDLYGRAQSLYVFDQANHLHQFKQAMGPGSEAVLYDQEIRLGPDLQDLIIMEPPGDRQQLKDLYLKQEWRRVYLGSYLAESKYLAGLPSRQDFKAFYQFLTGQPTFNLNQIPALSHHLQINASKIKLMIVVFFEAEFVKIEDGVVTKVTSPTNRKVDLFAMPAMAKYRLAMEAEAFFNYQTIDEIVTWMNEENSHEV